MAKASALRLFIESIALLNYSFLTLIELIKETKRTGIDVIIFSDRQTGLLSAIVGRIMRKKIIFSEGNLYPWYVSKPFKANVFSRIVTPVLGILACKISTNIRAQSNKIRRGMLDFGIAGRKIYVIPGGVDTDIFRPEDFTSIRNVIQIGFVGRLSEEKGALLLSQTISETTAEGILFAIVGTGNYLEKIKSMSNVKTFGNVPHDKLPQIMNSCDFFLVPHRDLALTVLEEMSCGKPIIAIECEDIREGVAHMSNGILCDANATSFSKAIVYLANNPDLLYTMGKNARATAINKYSWTHIAELWKQILVQKQMIA
jgi:glycosyltransferase involved in cell wall biosynthesis